MSHAWIVFFFLVLILAQSEHQAIDGSLTLTRKEIYSLSPFNYAILLGFHWVSFWAFSLYNSSSLKVGSCSRSSKESLFQSFEPWV